MSLLFFILSAKPSPSPEGNLVIRPLLLINSSSSGAGATTAANGSALTPLQRLLENETRKLSHCRKGGVESVEEGLFVCSAISAVITGRGFFVITWK
jgi:hypothetical protein